MDRKTIHAIHEKAKRENKRYKSFIEKLAKKTIKHIKSLDRGAWNDAFHHEISEHAAVAVWDDGISPTEILVFANNASAGVVDGPYRVKCDRLIDPTAGFPFEFFAIAALEADVNEVAVKLLLEEGIDINAAEFCIDKKDNED